MFMLASGRADGGGGLILITFNFSDIICCLLFCSNHIWHGTNFVGLCFFVNTALMTSCRLKSTQKHKNVSLEIWIVNAGNSKLRY